MKKNVKLMLGDNIESLKKLPDNSIDSVVSDPPYGLSFMNKKWDYDVPSVEFWKEVYRVLKPGGHVLSFGGTRTYHRMVVNIEDAGFEIRDQIQWIYGSGFPKSHNISKAISKINGENVKISKALNVTGNKHNNVRKNLNMANKGEFKPELYRHKPTTKEAIEFEGWGTALKPANEPICVARKPLSEKSVAQNVLKWKTGGINVDGCRIGSETIITTINKGPGNNGIYGKYKGIDEPTFNEGRFPANIILECICDEVIKGEKGEVKRSNNGNSKGFGGDKGVETEHYNDKGDIHTNPDCPCRILDEQSGVSKSSSNKWEGENEEMKSVGWGHKKAIRQSTFSDKGGASRFFYQAKVSKAERNMGLENIKSNHPTMKPVSLMSYLCRLVTPPNGIVLDPFMGSGSTGIAAQLEGFRFCGMEMDEDYFKIAEARIENFEKYKKFIK